MRQAIPKGEDPRQGIADDDLEAALLSAMPRVAQGSKMSDLLGLGAMFIVALGLGGVTLLSLNAQRLKPSVPVKTAIAEPQPAPMTTPMPQQLVLPPQPQPPVALPLPMPQPVATPAGDPKAPALVIDNSVAIADAQKSTAPAVPGGAGLSSDEAFAARLTSDVVGKAVKMANPSSTVPQGALIAAVMETAINSDLPGYARALVSRDVKSFDGTRIVIPRGSRLIGQYKSGLATGVTRAFVIWNRLIRPDGVSIQLASPATDEEGQAGLAGHVDNHFAKRFGAAILLSIINDLATNANARTSNTIVIGTASQAQGIAQDALTSDAKIPPTIKVAQGTAIAVFVARDLDFTP